METAGMAFREDVVEEAIEQTGERWTFHLGQCVSHRDHPMPSLVLTRVRTSHGAEIYGIRSFAFDDARRDRMMFGDMLVDVKPGSEPCEECLLYSAGLCPSQ